MVYVEVVMTKDITYHHDWTVVEFDAPERVVDRIEKERQISNWCWTHFPYGNWQVFSNRAFFQRESDATFFRLMWS